MKHLFLCMLTMATVFGTIISAEAKDPEDAESDHVIVTLKSGEKVDCYVHRGWHAETIRNRLNIRPTMSLALTTSK